MKTEHLILIGVIAAAFATAGIGTAVCAETGSIEDQIVAAIDPSKPIDFGTVFAVEDLHEKSEAHRKQIIQSLLKTLNTPPLSTTNKLANYDRCVAAYYLGQMGASEAVDGLAANITIQIGHLPPHYDFIGGGSPAVWALIEIGSRAIPARAIP